jgi:hypothetical protein
MTRKSVTSLALVAGCAIALAVPAAQAQVNSNWSGNPILNNKESREYMRLLQTNWNFRQARIQKECGPVTDPQLHTNCIASFDQYTPFVGSTRFAGNAWYPPNRASRGAPSSDMMTGSSTGTMTTTTGTTAYSPDMYGAGSGSSVPSANYTTPENAFGASRNLPAEQSGGMVQAPGAMPNYPGPRPSGPLAK